MELKTSQEEKRRQKGTKPKQKRFAIKVSESECSSCEAKRSGRDPERIELR